MNPQGPALGFGTSMANGRPERRTGYLLSAPRDAVCRLLARGKPGCKHRQGYVFFSGKGVSALDLAREHLCSTL